MWHIIFLSGPRRLRCNTSNFETTPPVGVVPGDFSNPLQIGNVAYHFSQRTEEITVQYFESGNHTPCGCGTSRSSDLLQIWHVAYHFSQRNKGLLIKFFKFKNHTPCGCGWAWFSVHLHIWHEAYHFAQRNKGILVKCLKSQNHTPCVGVVVGDFSRPVNSGCQYVYWHVDIS